MPYIYHLKDANNHNTFLLLTLIFIQFQGKGAYIKSVGGEGGRRVLQIFQKNFRSPKDHRPKYFMAQ